MHGEDHVMYTTPSKLLDHLEFFCKHGRKVTSERRARELYLIVHVRR